MTDNCCRTTDDGYEYCITSAPNELIRNGERAKSDPQPANTVRTWIAFGIACIASPCCTPMIVPAILALLAGTPVTVWIAHNIGWVYGILTVISITSLALGLHWLRQKSNAGGENHVI